MNLDERQKQTVTAWIQEGLTLSQIQNRLATELGTRLTYMEVRFLLDDLKLKPQDKESPPPVTPNLPETNPKDRTAPSESKTTGPRKETTAAKQPQTPGATGRVSVSVDQITRPGAVVSGSVTFTDGNAAEWYLDQLGRLGIAPKNAGYKPSQPDLMAFQTELQNELAKLGL